MNIRWTLTRTPTGFEGAIYVPTLPGGALPFRRAALPAVHRPARGQRFVRIRKRARSSSSAFRKVSTQIAIYSRIGLIF